MGRYVSRSLSSVGAPSIAAASVFLAVGFMEEATASGLLISHSLDFADCKAFFTTFLSPLDLSIGSVSRVLLAGDSDAISSTGFVGIDGNCVSGGTQCLVVSALVGLSLKCV